MIKLINNKPVEMSNEECSYCDELQKVFGKNVFDNSFSSDADGRIIAVTPSTTDPTSLIIIFFLLNLTMNQRLRAMDITFDKINILEKRISELEGIIK